jgi:hypothetical protein
VRVRDALAGDWDAIWPFFSEVVRAGETLAYDPDIGEEDARSMWMIGPPGRTVVAVDDDGAVAGTANMYANRTGGGSHVASGSFIVDPSRWGKGAGRARRGGHRLGEEGGLPGDPVQRGRRDERARRGPVAVTRLRDRGHGA